MDNNNIEEDPWGGDDMSYAEKQRALYKIYAFMVLVVGLMFLFMGIHLTLIESVVVMEVEGTTKSYTISSQPPQDGTDTTDTKKLYASDAPAESLVEEPQEGEVYVFYNVPLSDEIQRYTQDLCDAFGVQYAHVLATMKQESEYTPTAVSPINGNGTQDWGIMQINSGNHKWLEGELGITDWLDIRQNILAGIYIMSHYNHHGDNFQAIAMCYNSGPSKGRSNYEKGIYTTYSYEAMEELQELEERYENLRTEKR